MATMSALRIAKLLPRNSAIISRNFPVRYISTSKKNRETATLNDVVEKTEANTDSALKKKNWVTYGFDFHDEKEDRFFAHCTMFFGISVCFVGGTFFLTYYPDWASNDWTQREAFLELRRREAAGLPLIDANLVSPSKINLPSDEELGDTEIII